MLRSKSDSVPDFNFVVVATIGLCGLLSSVYGNKPLYNTVYSY